MMNLWYAVHTHARAEEKALFNLVKQGYAAYLPRFRKVRRHARKVDSILAPLFPRYLFVGFDRNSMPLRPINGTFGVHYLVCQGDRPVPLPGGLVEELVARERPDGSVELSSRPIRKGDRLRVVEGALADRVGLFEQMSDNDRVVILMNLLGERTRVTVPRRMILAEA